MKYVNKNQSKMILAFFMNSLKKERLTSDSYPLKDVSHQEFHANDFSDKL